MMNLSITNIGNIKRALKKYAKLTEGEIAQVIQFIKSIREGE
jgi:hypothetical protein